MKKTEQGKKEESENKRKTERLQTNQKLKGAKNRTSRIELNNFL
jgi:hypothetical protein